MSQLSDIEIIDLCNPVMEGRHGMIEPFLAEQVREIEYPTGYIIPRECDPNCDLPDCPYIHQSGLRMIRSISAGVSSYGYDFRLSPKSFRVFHNALGHVLVDPKNFDPRLLIEQPHTVDETGTFFVIPGNSYALSETIEYIRIPRSIMGVSVGKSTYARCGLGVNVTPLEPGWDGIVTVELLNSCPAPIKVYANEGIFQTIFLQGKMWPRTTYADRASSYQGQTGLTLAKV